MASAVAFTFGLYGYGLTYALGFIGHTCSFITFSSKTLRETSTGLLFIFLTFSDLSYQLMTTYDFILLYLLVPTQPNPGLCRFRTFILNFFTFTSAWILVLISIDRFIRARFPYQQARLCTKKMTFYSLTVVCVCSNLLTCHVLQSEFAYTDVESNTCGPSRSTSTTYTKFFFNIWPIMQVIINYFIPSCLMMIFVISIHAKVRLQRAPVVAIARRERVQQQMLILMISSVVCFAVCTLAFSIHRVIYSRTGVTTGTVDQIIILTFIFNLNYCLNFYIHCLASKLFRQKFIKQLKNIFPYFNNQRRQRANNTVYPLATINRPGVPPAVV